MADLPLTFTPPKTVRPITLTCGAVLVFDSEQPAALKPLYLDVAEQLREAFRLTSLVAVETAESPVAGWRADRGTIEVNGKHLRLSRAEGTDRIVRVLVEGDSAYARQALQVFWSRLCEITQHPADDLVNIGAVLEHTAAIVELPHRFDRLFPGSAVMRDLISERLPNAPKDPMFRFKVELPIKVAQLRLEEAFILEPRAHVPQDRRQFYSVSPLATQAHFEILDALCERAAK